MTGTVRPAPLAPRPVTPAGIVAARIASMVADLAPGDDSPLARELRSLDRLTGGMDGYLQRVTTSPSAQQRQVADATAHHDWSTGHAVAGLEQEMLSGHVEAQTLAVLVRATRARRVLEIGTFTGYATLAMAEALPADGVLVTCERDEATAAMARTAFAASPVGANIELRVGPAGETLDALVRDGAAAFDLVFVDADKAGYVGYVAALLDGGLLAEHGLLCVDNTLMQGEPWTAITTANGAAIGEFNDWLAADPRIVQAVVPLRDGLTLACRVPQ